MLIATRQLKLISGNVAREVPVRVHSPELIDGIWRCQFEIGWPEGMWSGAAGGIDAVQALEVALKLIGADLYSSEHHRSGALAWETPNGGYGFPVPRAMRNLLVGDDKILDG